MKITKNELKQMIKEALHEANFAGRADLQRPVDKAVGTNAKEAFEQTIKDLVVELNQRFSADKAGNKTGKNSFVQKPYLDKDWTPEGVMKVIIEFTTVGSKECATLYYKDNIARWLREQPRIRQQNINVASRMTDDDSVYEYILSCNVGASSDTPKDNVNQLAQKAVIEELRLDENGRGYSRDVWQITDMNQFLDSLVNYGNNKLGVKSIGELWEQVHNCNTCRYKSQCDVLYAETGEKLSCAELMNIMVGESDVTG